MSTAAQGLGSTRQVASTGSAKSRDSAIPLPLLTATEAANRLGISPWTLHDWRKRGADNPLPYVRVGRAARYRPEDIAAYVERNRVAGIAA